MKRKDIRSLLNEARAAYARGGFGESRGVDLELERDSLGMNGATIQKDRVQGVAPGLPRPRGGSEGRNAFEFFRTRRRPRSEQRSRRARVEFSGGTTEGTVHLVQHGPDRTGVESRGFEHGLKIFPNFHKFRFREFRFFYLHDSAPWPDPGRFYTIIEGKTAYYIMRNMLELFKKG